MGGRGVDALNNALASDEWGWLCCVARFIYTYCVDRYRIVSCAAEDGGTHTVHSPFRVHWHTVTAGVPPNTPHIHTHHTHKQT